MAITEYITMAITANIAGAGVIIGYITRAFAGYIASAFTGYIASTITAYITMAITANIA
jgi:hypothetical protein